MLVGLPMSKAIEKVFAATNSSIKNGRGEILALLQKLRMNGVKVKTTMSLEVKTVRSPVTK